MDGLEANLPASQGEAQPSQTQAQPTTLEEAMRALRSNNAPAPTGDVGDPSLAEKGNLDTGGQPATGSNGEGDAGNPAGAAAPDSNLSEGSTGAGESTAQPAGGDGNPGDGGTGGQPAETPAYTADDYKVIQDRILESVTQQAARKADEEFQKQGIRLWNINDLYERDEQTGRVSFKDPENPGSTFSSRFEAQQWIEAMNKQVQDAWQQEARKYQREFFEQTQPAIRLMQFAPVYDNMDQQTKAVFDSIVEPYEIKDSTGASIGFSCDLNAAKAQAEKLVQVFGGGAQVAPAAGEQQTQAAPAATGPALDAATSGSSSGANPNPEPKDIADAMKILNQQKKAEREKGKNNG